MSDAFSYQDRAKALIETTRRNLVTIAPTGAGKTKVAYFALAFHEKGCYIAPTRALCYEVAHKLRTRFPSKKVVIANKDYDLSSEDFASADIRVLTQFALARMIATFDDFAELVSVVIFDEFQNFDQVTEMNVVQLHRLFPEVRLVCLSATIHPDDRPLLADWLDAELVVSTKRPVALRHRVVHFDREQFHIVPLEGGETQDYLCMSSRVQSMLTAIRIEDQHPVLIWTPSRSTAERFCFDVRELVAGEPFERPRVSALAREVAKLPARDAPAYKTLAEVLPYGIGLHHGGLTGEERELVQRLAESGALREIVTCFTLLQGVNLPAKHILIPQLHRYGKRFDGLRPAWQEPDSALQLTSTEFHQLIGRAGRPQYDQDGFTWIGVSSEPELRSVRNLLTAPPTRLTSELGEVNFLVRCLPYIISRGIGKQKELVNVLRDSFWHRIYPQAPKLTNMKAALKLLFDAGAVEMPGAKEYVLTEKGRIYARLGIHPTEFGVIETLTAARDATFHTWIEQLGRAWIDSSVNASAKPSDVSLITTFGLSLFHRPEMTTGIAELADGAQRLLDLALIYFRLTATPADFVEPWKEAVYGRYLYGRMILAERLHPVIGSPRVKRLVRQLGPDLLCLNPEQLQKSERAALLRCLTRNERRAIDVNRLSTVFRLPPHELFDEISRLDS